MGPASRDTTKPTSRLEELIDIMFETWSSRNLERKASPDRAPTGSPAQGLTVRSASARPPRQERRTVSERVKREVARHQATPLEARPRPVLGGLHGALPFHEDELVYRHMVPMGSWESKRRRGCGIMDHLGVLDT